MKNRKAILTIGMFTLLSSIFLSCDTSNSVDMPDYFVKYYGVDGNQEGVDMIANTDGTYFLFGNSTLPGKDQQLYLVKGDANGNIIWQKFLGDPSYTDQARDIEVTSDGKLVLAATTFLDPSGDKDVRLIITDQDGNKLDSAVYGYTGTDETVSSVTQINNGYIVTGATTNVGAKPNQVANDQMDIFVFRFNADLTRYATAWTETLGPGTYDAGVKIAQISNDLFYFFGYTNQKPPQHTTANFNFVIYQLNGFGIPVGASIYAGTSLTDERLTSVSLNSAESGGGYFLTGVSTESSGQNSLFITRIVKDLNTNSSGVINLDDNFLYQKNFSSSLGAIADLKTASVQSRLSGFFILSNENLSGSQDFTLAKAANDGSEAWTNPGRFTFGGSGTDNVGSVVELPNGKIVMIGTFAVGDDGQKKMTLIKVNKDGKFRD